MFSWYTLFTLTSIVINLRQVQSVDTGKPTDPGLQNSPKPTLILSSSHRLTKNKICGEPFCSLTLNYDDAGQILILVHTDEESRLKEILVGWNIRFDLVYPVVTIDAENWPTKYIIVRCYLSHDSAQAKKAAAEVRIYLGSRAQNLRNEEIQAALLKAKEFAEFMAEIYSATDIRSTWTDEEFTEILFGNEWNHNWTL